ncbi:serine/threonine-protein kinase [Aquabacterium olei]|uniref:serine/threonine-protein kinase n=1 Tax=Aquabacterium olei TaxID=1296669 RepID=UPI00131F25CC|nr:serine/threonine-protein kinase [Aquabacterium olei]
MSTSPSRPALNAPLDLDLDAPADDDRDTVAETRPLPDPTPSERTPERPDLLPSIGHIGRYALKYVIGEGGLGTVYAAYDPLLSRLIAIKTLHVDLPQADRAQFDALFLNEAKAAGSLNHAHIVTVYDAGASERGPYIAMELLKGKDLRQLLQMGWQPSPIQAALIVRRVADALSYAHHKGVIHRDIKPANIFMVGRTQPRVLDFGIARIRQVESLAQRDDPQSRFQDIAGGSPYYMAPEQMRRLPVDRRVDVYGLGAVLYELLTGRRAIAGDTLEAITDAVLNGPREPVRAVNPAVPQALSGIVERAMARDPDQRTRSARRLAQELRDWLEIAERAQEGLAGHGDAALPKIGRDAAREARSGGTRPHRRLLGGVVAVVGAAAVAGWWMSSTPTARRVAASQVAAVSSTPPPARAAVAESRSLPPLAAPPPASAAVATSGPVEAADTTPGTVRLAISPWGEVAVDGEVKGVTPPLNQLKLAPGRYTVTIRNGEAPVFRQTVEVQPGRELRIRHKF